MVERSRSSQLSGPLVPRTAFPLLMARDIAYLDSAASAQKPKVVLDRMRQFYETSYANIHRAVYPLSEAATEVYESARTRVARFLKAPSSESIVFTQNATEAINLIAHSFGGPRLKQGDRILVTMLEHHANIVPWQLLRDRLGLELLVAPIDGAGNLDLEAMDRQLAQGPKLVAVTAASNALGTRTPIKDVVAGAHRVGAAVMVDAAQAAPHGGIDAIDWDCDFLVFTGHKLYGPDGIGVLYGKPELLASMPPWQGGGDMIRTVSFAHTEFADPPQRFEAGTPPIGPAVGLATAIDFIEAVGWDRVEAHDKALTGYALERLQDIPGIRLIGAPQERIGIVSFTLDGVHPHDVGSLLGERGVCVRTGHHCAQPLMDHLGLPGTIRASFGVHNDAADIDRLADALVAARQILAR
ncbi:aminotransferase class V-fold PLP-dependent enzyme [Dongia deserti]|uniref:aminotransferase class V-fold PLP-dependent enzyme n=1 Tax=Dongia deserti TaxID=2268030 RepID=UPI000E657357|nr:cysteine desulfurase [Dongia deserti]